MTVFSNVVFLLFFFFSFAVGLKDYHISWFIPGFGSISFTAESMLDVCFKTDFVVCIGRECVADS